MRRIVSAITTVIVLAGSALAHHGYADFFLDQRKSIEGVIHQMRFQNPHVVLTIRTADSTLYTATWDAADRVERYGATSTSLKIGDHVIVTGAPPRDPASRELMPVRAIVRPRDGWKWPQR